MKEMSLITGGKVMLEIGSVCAQNQTLVRIGNRLIMGVIEGSFSKGVYLWQEVDGVYQYLGNIIFKDQEDGSVVWDIRPWTHNTPEFEKRAADFLAEQGRLHTLNSFTGDNIKMLSMASGAKVE